jgi:hypothetical protein
VQVGDEFSGGGGGYARADLAGLILIAMVLLVDHLADHSMVAVIPLLCAGTFTAAHALTRGFGGSTGRPADRADYPQSGVTVANSSGSDGWVAPARAARPKVGSPCADLLP